MRIATEELAVKFEYLHIMNATVVNMKSQCCPDYMKTLNACSSRIDDQHISFRVTDYFQDMRMATYEYIRLITVYKFTGSRVISARIASDMGHQYLHAFTFKEAMKRMNETKVMIVTVSGNARKRLEGGYLFSQFHSPTEVAGMPYPVHRFEELAELLVKNPMRI